MLEEFKISAETKLNSAIEYEEMICTYRMNWCPSIVNPPPELVAAVQMCIITISVSLPVYFGIYILIIETSKVFKIMLLI